MNQYPHQQGATTLAYQAVRQGGATLMVRILAISPWGLRPVSRLASFLLIDAALAAPSSSRLARRETISQRGMAGY